MVTCWPVTTANLRFSLWKMGWEWGVGYTQSHTAGGCHWGRKGSGPQPVCAARRVADCGHFARRPGRQLLYVESQGLQVLGSFDSTSTPALLAASLSSLRRLLLLPAFSANLQGMQAQQGPCSSWCPGGTSGSLFCGCLNSGSPWKLSASKGGSLGHPGLQRDDFVSVT